MGPGFLGNILSWIIGLKALLSFPSLPFREFPYKGVQPLAFVTLSCVLPPRDGMFLLKEKILIQNMPSQLSYALCSQPTKRAWGEPRGEKGLLSSVIGGLGWGFILRLSHPKTLFPVGCQNQRFLGP